MPNKLKTGFLISFFCALVFLAGCDQFKDMFKTTMSASSREGVPQTAPAQVHGTVLARVNNDVITLESFDDKVKRLQALSPDIRLDTFEAKKGYLNDLVTQELVFQEAKARGIEKKKDVREAVEEFKKGVMANQLILDETKGITVEPSEIDAFYTQYKKAFAAPADYKVREIIVASESVAKDILISLLQGADFAAIAKDRSIAPDASSGGDMGFVKLGDQFDKFNEVLLTLEAGQISQIFSGPKGYYVIKVEEKKGGEVPNLTDNVPGMTPPVTVYEQIKNGLLQQKQAQRLQELTDKLRRDAKIEIKEDLLR